MACTIECGIVTARWRFRTSVSFSFTDVQCSEVCPSGMSKFKETSQRASLEDRPGKAAQGLEASPGGRHRWRSAGTVWSQPEDVVLVTLFCLSGLGLDEEPHFGPSSSETCYECERFFCPCGVQVVDGFGRGYEVWFTPYA